MCANPMMTLRMFNTDKYSMRQYAPFTQINFNASDLYLIIFTYYIRLKPIEHEVYNQYSYF